MPKKRLPPKFPDQAMRQKDYLDRQRAAGRELVSMIVSTEALDYIDSLPFQNRGQAVDFIVNQVLTLRSIRGPRTKYKKDIEETTTGESANESV